MNAMIIGSRALHYWIPEYPISERSDWDVISDLPVNGCEWHKPDEYLSDEFVARFSTDETLNVGGREIAICSLRGLAAIKRSHLALNWNWVKHISQYHKYLAPHLNENDMPLVRDRQKLTLEHYKQKAPSLKKRNDDFFNDYVTKVYDHDHIHELAAYYDVPLYTRLKNPSGEDVAWCERDLWDQLSHTDKLKCISEEVTVISVERFLVPSDWTTYNQVAYAKALQMVCTHLTSGWFRDYAIEHWPELRVMVRPETYHYIRSSLTQSP